jgi:hypothetical protein
MNTRLASAIVAFLVLPGVVAVLMPLFVVAPAPGSFSDQRGLVPLGLGAIPLFWRVREFYVAGRGTLAPWAPPERLVVTGLYRSPGTRCTSRCC